MASGIPTNRTNITLPMEVSNEILQKTQEASIIMRLAQQTPLPGRGLAIPVILSDPEAEFVAETDAKPVSNPGLGTKLMQPHMLSVIVPLSNQFRRDANALYNAIVARIPNALGKKFDKVCFFGPTGGSLANFDNLSAVAQASLQSSVYLGLVAADTDISEEGGLLNGFAFSPQGRGMLLSALDGQNRPLFNNVGDGDINRVLGAPTYFSSAAYKAGAAASGSDAAVPDIVGFAGDWTKARWGTVEGVKIDISDEATLTYTDENEQTVTVNLWQRNMFAVRAEIEVGFVAQTAYFNALTRTHS